MSKDNYQALLGDNEYKWKCCTEDCWRWGERWELLKYNPKAGYHQYAGRVIKLNGRWQSGVQGKLAEVFYTSPQDAAKALLKELYHPAT